ncbi:MAG TPA: DNA polymerase III subunit beta [Firmicutes bacterium]|jgi:DNA polymerase-3 subunit beta|nr:DNA polymerase III subunit beta [Bacillota bacterium]
MKLICSQEELARSLQIATRVLPAKTSIPVLNGLVLETRNDQLYCFGSDLENGLEIKVPGVTIITPGRVVLGGRTFYDVIRHLPPGRIEMEIAEDRRTFGIKTAHTFFTLNILPAEEYPAVPDGLRTVYLYTEEQTEEPGKAPLFTLSASVFEEAVRQSIYATAPNDSRPFLSSVLWELKPEALRLVATDINRLVIKDLKVDANREESFLVPVKALKEMATIFGNDPERELTFFLINRQLYAAGSGIIYYTRLINAQFPRYEQVIPESFDGEARFDRMTIVSALTRSLLIDKAVKLSFAPDLLTIFASDPELGQFVEEVSCAYAGEPFAIGFNAQYITAFLRAIGSEKEIVFQLSNGMKASVLRVKDNNDYTYVLMPLRLNY